MELMEAAAEADDELLEKYFEEETLSFDEIRQGMRLASRSPELKTVPVFATSATENIGTVPLMEALVAYASSPAERRVNIMRGEDSDVLQPPQSDDDPLAAYVFKTLNDRLRRHLELLPHLSPARSPATGATSTATAVPRNASIRSSSCAARSSCRSTSCTPAISVSLPS